MSRTQRPLELLPFEQFAAVGENAPPLEEKIAMAQTIRARSQEASVTLDKHLIGEITRLHTSIHQLRETQSELRQVLERMKGSPWFLGTYLGTVSFGSTTAAVVATTGGARRAVRIADSVDASALAVGDEILMSQDSNTLVGLAPNMGPRHGQVATVDRLLPGDRMIIRCRDEEFVVGMAGSLCDSPLRSGDMIHWDRDTWLALEQLERPDGQGLFLEETPSLTFDDIGGLNHQIDELLCSLRLYAFNADTAMKYGSPVKKSVLLVGPPGTGKTMMARALVNWLASNSKSGRARFMNVKPSSLHSMWYSESERQWRECFRVAREAGRQDPATPCVIFIDEVDSVGNARGNDVTRANDQVLAALLAELDGLEERGNVLVVSATNRLEALDPALPRPGRLGDLVLEIPRPNRSGARAILAKHLRPGIPYWQNGHADSEAARSEIIASGVSRLYSENGESHLATLTFRDGKRRKLAIRDVVSGALLANVARDALERACLREIQTGDAGVRTSDVLESIHREFERTVCALTPANCRNHLSDLGQDVDVVSVEPVAGAMGTHRYMRSA